MAHQIEVFIDISAVKELAGVQMTAECLEVGATKTLSQLIAALENNATDSPSYEVLARQMKRVANWQVRNVGSWAGNLVMARTKGFASDIVTLLMSAGASLKLYDSTSSGSSVSDVHSFIRGDDMGGTIIQSVTIPKCAEGEVLFAYRTAMRPVNAHAFVNSCFRATVKDGVMSNVKLAFGVVQHKAVFAEEACHGGRKARWRKLGSCAGRPRRKLEMDPETQYFCTEQPEGS